MSRNSEICKKIENIYLVEVQATNKFNGGILI